MIPHTKTQIIQILEGIIGALQANEIEITQVSSSGCLDSGKITSGTIGFAFDMVDPNESIKDALNEMLQEREVNDED